MCFLCSIKLLCKIFFILPITIFVIWKISVLRYWILESFNKNKKRPSSDPKRGTHKNTNRKSSAFMWAGMSWSGTQTSKRRLRGQYISMYHKQTGDKTKNTLHKKNKRRDDVKRESVPTTHQKYIWRLLHKHNNKTIYKPTRTMC